MHSYVTNAPNSEKKLKYYFELVFWWIRLFGYKKVREISIAPFWLEDILSVRPFSNWCNLKLLRSSIENTWYAFLMSILTTLSNCYEAFTPNIYLSKSLIAPIALIAGFFSQIFVIRCVFKGADLPTERPFWWIVVDMCVCVCVCVCVLFLWFSLMQSL